MGVVMEEYAQVASAELIEGIVRLLSVDSGTRMTAVSLPYHRYTLSSLRGLGKEIWEGIDARDYVNRLRDEWGR